MIYNVAVSQPENTIFCSKMYICTVCPSCYSGTIIYSCKHRVIHSIVINGSIFKKIMHPNNRTGEGECYQINKNIQAVYNEKSKKLVSLTFKCKKIDPDQYYSFGIAGYHFNACKDYLGFTKEELNSKGDLKVITTSMREAMEEYLRNHQNINCVVEGRLIFNK